MIFDRMEECTETEVQRMLPLVSDQRREQALKYRHTFGQFCCLKSWLMLIEGIRGYGISESEDFKYNEHGKPYWENGPYFSISHCKDAIAVVIDNESVGIDIEAIRHTDEELVKRIMNEEEVRLVNETTDEKERNRAFIRLWTRKEAIVKAQGIGIESFEQLQTVLNNEEWNLKTIEKNNYIYSIAYGKLHCFSAKV